MKPKLSLRGRGLQLLAQREHSRLELRRKLMQYARAECKAREAAAQVQVAGNHPAGTVPAGLDRSGHGCPIDAENAFGGILDAADAGVDAHLAPEGGHLRPGRGSRPVSEIAVVGERRGGGRVTAGVVGHLSIPFQQGAASSGVSSGSVASNRIDAARAVASSMLPVAIAAGAGGGCPGESAADTVDEACTPEQLVEAVLDWLEARAYLSEERFVESRVHARAGRFGNQRIRQELAQHGVTLAPDELQALKDSELARARSVWARKFGDHPADPAERGRQMRFLAGRGFSSEVVRRVVQGGDDD